MFIWIMFKAKFFWKLLFTIYKIFDNLDRSILILLLISMFYCLRSFKICSDLVFFGKFVLGIIFKVDDKDFGYKNSQKNANSQLKFMA